MNYISCERAFQECPQPTYLELILTNNVIAFQNTAAAFTSLSDFHQLVLTVLLSSITISKLQKITCINKCYGFSEY